MIKILNMSLFFMLFTSCYAAHGKNNINIEGAFGLKFGDVSDKSQAKKYRASDKELYEARLVFSPSIFNKDPGSDSFSPSQKIKPFIKYSTISTPLTKKIYTINAESAPMSLSGCFREKNIISALLENKYKMSMTDRGVVGCPVKYYRKDKVSVFVSCNCDVDNKLSIKYYHDDFATLAYAEKSKIRHDKKNKLKDKKFKMKQRAIKESKNRDAGGL